MVFAKAIKVLPLSYLDCILELRWRVWGGKDFGCPHQRKGTLYPPPPSYSPNHQTKEREFYIKWKGYSAFVNSWEPEKNLSGCQNLVDEFMWSRNPDPSKENLNSKRNALSKTPKIAEMSSVNDNYVDIESDSDSDAIINVKRPNVHLSNQEIRFLSTAISLNCPPVMF